MSEPNAAATRVYDELRRQIMTWQLPPGTALREVQIAAEFNVSRTPVRDAIQRLRSDGLIEPRGRRGVEVSRWNPRELEDTYRLRANLEAWAARLAAERPNLLDLPRLRELADEMSALARSEPFDHERIAELNIEFHESIRSAAGSDRLVTTLTTVVHIPLLHRVFTAFTPEQVATTCQEHHTIIAALEAGDGDWAESITRAHILAALNALKGPRGLFATTNAEGT
ncbi:GntR family transcriptional regulator [Saccharopolyspora oryzae]|uniref:GntR family transcriptional regulator n=1 Tax=Saccharopolyspora oryzae TaxID=2997343 RepID=A0ABT4V9Y9_9PSEU|nr:GntR family transcriptional regulator [Saccharopolyspora oryzae]MDA3630780.1 GntR family transcriptional regulator [Saccharopolyspora oryzae]